MQPALEVRRIRVFDPGTNREYASGCRVSREDYRFPEFAARVPLNTTYAADVYTTDVWTSVTRDTRSAAEICGESHEPVILSYRDVPSCLSSYTSTILAIYPIDENGAEVDFASTSTQLGVRYLMTNQEYGPVEFNLSPDCNGPYTFGYWDIVP